MPAFSPSSDARNAAVHAVDPGACSSPASRSATSSCCRPRVRFFQNFNSSEFNVLVQASQYYNSPPPCCWRWGSSFQIPVAILAATRAGIVTPRQLRRNRRYAMLACGASPRSCRATRSRCARDRAAVPAVRGEPAAREHRRTTRPPCTELPVRHRRRKLGLRVGSASREPRPSAAGSRGSLHLCRTGPIRSPVLEAGALPTADSRCGDARGRVRSS